MRNPFARYLLAQRTGWGWCAALDRYVRISPQRGDDPVLMEVVTEKGVNSWITGAKSKNTHFVEWWMGSWAGDGAGLVASCPALDLIDRTKDYDSFLVDGSGHRVEQLQ